MKADALNQIPGPALLWTLLSVVMVLAPEVLRMPFWITITAMLCICWRILIYQGRLPFPGRFIRSLVVVFTLVVSASQIRSIGVGLDSAASLLALGFVFKLIEMRRRRDIYIVVVLCFIMIMVAFLYSQSVISTIYLCLCLVAVTSTMVSINRPPAEPDNPEVLRFSLKLFAQALPLTVVLFLVFPRIAPLWAVPVQNTGSATGVTDEMSPGDISQLGRSADLAFRVQFENTLPPLHADLYWRGLVLDQFDGETWRRRRSRSSFGSASQFASYPWASDEIATINGEPIAYNVIMEPSQQPWLFALHLADPRKDDLFQTGKFELFNRMPVTQRISYDVESYLDNSTNEFLLSSARRTNTQLPESGNSRSRDLARALRDGVATDRDYVYAVLAYFQSNEFFYTLNPPLLGQNRVDDFLFSSMAGFCEHYASSFAFLMRAVGIPARVVVGYHGAEYNRFEDYMMVYQYNAHAWNEVWINGEGWVRVDPTGAVSPERIEQGVEAALRDDPNFLEESLLAGVRFGQMDWLNTLRLRLDAIEYEWNRRVVNYDEEVQFELFQDLIGDTTESRVLGLLVLLSGLVVVAVGFSILRSGQCARGSEIEQAYRAFCQKLDSAGCPRITGEGPLQYRNRLNRVFPGQQQQLDRLSDIYIALNYRSDVQSESQQRALVKEFRTLLSGLRLRQAGQGS